MTEFESESDSEVFELPDDLREEIEQIEKLPKGRFKPDPEYWKHVDAIIREYYREISLEKLCRFIDKNIRKMSKNDIHMHRNLLNFRACVVFDIEETTNKGDILRKIDEKEEEEEG